MTAFLRRFARRLQAFFGPSRVEDELSREVDAHLGLLEEQFQQRGMTADDARRAARRALGRVDAVKAVQRDARSFIWLEDARIDLRYTVRTLAKAPGFTFLAVLTLGLGIGAVTVIYSVIHNVLLDPLPYPRSDRFVNVVVEDAATGRWRAGLSIPEFLEYRDRSTVFEDVVGTRAEPMLLTMPGRADVFRAVWVTPNFFPFMGLQPLLGRVITDDDGRPGASPVAVLRYRAWITSFGGDPGVVGRTISLNGTPRTIVGVMPPRFTWHAADVWIPGPVDGSGPMTPRSFQARLKPGVTIAQADSQLMTIATPRAREYPQEYPQNFRVRAHDVIDGVVGDFRGVLYTLLAAVGLLMLIACCNVANMLLARATAREREMTVRAAIGAGRGRIVRQLLVESLLLAFAGAALGCLIAYWGIRGLVPQLPPGPLPGEVEIVLNAPALVVSLCTAVLSALLFGIAPALYSARLNLVDGLRTAGKGVSAERGRLRSALVVAEIALSLVLLLSAGLLMRSFLSLARVDLGFDPNNAVFARPAFLPGSYETTSERRRLYRQWLERIDALPGVKTAGTTTGLPPYGGFALAMSVLGRETPEQSQIRVQWCSDGYLPALGQRLVAGRGLSEDAMEEPRPVAVVNRAFVRAYLDGGDALGRQIRVAMPGPSPGETQPVTFEIIGVVQDVNNSGVREVPAPEVYLPGLPPGMNPMVLVRTTGDPGSVANGVREALRLLDPQVALSEGTLADTLYRSAYAQPRFSVIVLAVFAVVGMVLVAIGVYSVMAYSVSRQKQELAVRIALGAQRGQVFGLILRRSAVLVAVGVAVGLIASLLAGRLIATQLWNTSATDPLTAVAGVGLVVLVALLASTVPARRAMRIEPMTAMRE